VKYSQRASVPKESFSPTDQLWQPELRLEDGTILKVEPKARDYFVVVDEIVDEKVRLVESAWPTVDVGERLAFVDAGSEVADAIRLETLQTLVDRLRTPQKQVARPIRVGDAFLIREEPARPSQWRYLLDVTQASRQAAKVAQLRAIVPPPTGALPKEVTGKRAKRLPKPGRPPKPKRAGARKEALAEVEAVASARAIEDEPTQRARQSRPSLPGSSANAAI